MLKTDHRNLVYLQKAPNAKLTRWRLRLEEFEFEIEHVPGKDNIIADVLSRFHQGQPKLLASIYTELDDSFIGKVRIAQQTEMKNYSGLMREDGLFVTKDGFLIIPEKADKLKKEILKLAHGSHLVGHHGESAMVKFIHGLGLTWTNLKKSIHETVTTCLICQKTRLKKKAVKVYASTASEYPFQVVAVDTLGPLKKSKTGLMYVMVFIDCFTRLVELVPTVSTSAKEAADALLKTIVFRYGLPQTIRSDRGSQFYNLLYEHLLASLGIKHHRVLTYNPQANGIVERINYEIMKILKSCFADGTPVDDWDLQLPYIQFLLNTRIHSELGTSPHEMVFGTGVMLAGLNPLEKLDRPTELDLTRFKGTPTSQQAARDYVLELTEQLQKRHAIIRENWEKKVKRRQTELEDEVPVEKGDFAWLSPLKKNKRKESLKFRGPVLVKEVISPSVARIMYLNNGYREEVPMSRLKKVEGEINLK
ncbi:hypothetical protein ADUPG1_001280, partial [Aduncisulcus paluster]